MENSHNKTYVRNTRTETRGQKRKNDRLMFDAILWIMNIDLAWSDLHPEFMPWETVNKGFLEWMRLKIQDYILLILSITVV